MKYQIQSYNKQSKWIQDIEDINEKAWPKFMQGERVMRSYWGFLLGNFHKYQHVLTHDNVVIAIVNSAPIWLDPDVNQLHDNGIYWGLKQVTHNYYKGIKPNTLLALQIVVNPDFRGKRLSYECIKILKKLAQTSGFDRVVIPLRPSLKHLYPLVNKNDYINWKNEEGFPYDPWLRVHIKAGGEVVKQCKGISIRASIQEWEEWTGLCFRSTGEYIVSDALNPVYADLDKNLVTYTQDNVWVLHKV